VNPAKLSALAKRGDAAFRDPIVITRDRVVIDGYARWELSKRVGRRVLECIEHELNVEEAIGELIKTHDPSRGLTDFVRIVIALDLESHFQERAFTNQQAGGKSKGSSKLTKAESIDVRREIAKLAGVSVGNVTKVKQLVPKADPKINDALTHGQIRIHRAWLWRGEPAERQRRLLLEHISKTGVKRKIRELISQHKRAAQAPLDAAKLASLLSNANSQLLGEITIACCENVGTKHPCLPRSIE